MERPPAWILVLLYSATVLRASASSPTPPEQGFEQNTGQHQQGVLFALEQRVFRANSVGLSGQLSLEFAGSDPPSSILGRHPVPFPLNLYSGADPSLWRENVPHFATVRYSQIYQGIDAEWNTGRTGPMLRLMIAPGADPGRIEFQLRGEPGLRIWVYPTWVFASPGSFRFEKLSAYQVAGSSITRVGARFEQSGANTFRLSLDPHDACRELVVEIGEAFRIQPYAYSIEEMAAGSGSALVGHSWIARIGGDDRPIYLTKLSGISASSLKLEPDGAIVAVAARVAQDTNPPITAGAPRASFVGDRPESWIGAITPGGRLSAATLTGGQFASAAFGAGPTVYFANPDGVSAWSPGDTRFRFTNTIRGVVSLSVGARAVAFLAVRLPDQPTTLGAVRDRYVNISDVYAGTLDLPTGTRLMSTYVPVYLETAPLPRDLRASVVMAPGGELWISASLFFPERAVANTLIALSPDGSQILRSASSPSHSNVSVDANGDVWVLISTGLPNLPTTSTAARRAGCDTWLNLYMQRFTPGGTLLHATYLPVSGYLRSFGGPDQVLVQTRSGYPKITRVDATRPGTPGIACIVHAASWQQRHILVPGGLYTIVGYGFGGSEAISARLDRPLPHDLGATEVWLDGERMPLLSTEPGLVTFQIPETASTTSGRIEIRSAGITAAVTYTAVQKGGDFALLTSDGSGRGLAAAVNQDGTVNGPGNPARLSSTVSLFGTGPLPPALNVSIGGIRNSWGVPGRAEIAYAGTTQHMPVVKQINLRLPAGARDTPAGWVLIRIGPSGSTMPPSIIPVIIYVAPPPL